MNAEERCRLTCAWKGGGPCLADDCPRKALTSKPQFIGEDGPMASGDCARWLEAKFARHGELEDKASAELIRWQAQEIARLTAIVDGSVHETPAEHGFTLEELRFIANEFYASLSCGATDSMFAQVLQKSRDLQREKTLPGYMRAVKTSAPQRPETGHSMLCGCAECM